MAGKSGTAVLMVIALAAECSSAVAQISVAECGVPVRESFDALGGSATAPLPSGWRVAKDGSSVRAIGGWTAADSATERRAGDGMSTNAANGIYNFGAGDPAAATDRCPGFLATGGGTKSGTLYARYRNATGGAIGRIEVSFAVEKYRHGSNAEGFRVQLYSSSDGESWTSAGSRLFASFAPDADNTGFAHAPDTAIRLEGAIEWTVPDGGELFLAWNYSVAIGSVTSSAPALGVDDVAVTAYPAAGPTLVQFLASSSRIDEGAGHDAIAVGILNPSGATATTVDVALAGGTASNGVDVSPAFATRTLVFPAGSGVPQTIDVPIVQDSVFEGDETLIFALQNPTGGNAAALGSLSSHVATIRDDDSSALPAVLVNEYHNAAGDISTTEAIELLVARDGADLRGYIVEDASAGGVFPYSTLVFSHDSLWSSLPRGTLVVIGGLFSVPVPDADPRDGLVLVRAPGGGQSNAYFETPGQAIEIAGASDAVAVYDAAHRFVHGLAHGTANRFTLPAGRHGWTSGSAANGRSVCFRRDDAPLHWEDFFSNDRVAFSHNTLGAPNDTAGNRAFLRELRSRTVCGSESLAGAFYWNVTVDGGLAALSGPVTIGNRLLVAAGSFDQNGHALAIDRNADARNGTGAGAVEVGDGTGRAALLSITDVLDLAAGTAVFDRPGATVEYRGVGAQEILPADYFHLSLLHGGESAPKSLRGDATVAGTLTIAADACLEIDTARAVVLVSSAEFADAGCFLGTVEATRNVDAPGVEERFGGIGLSMTTRGGTPPGETTVRMTSGRFVWVDDLPSILRSYRVVSAHGAAADLSLSLAYDSIDLAGQSPAALGAWRSTDGGTNWMWIGGASDPGSQTVSCIATGADGTWTMHADPPRGELLATPAFLSFVTEEDYQPPDPRTLAMSNANGSGSVVSWTATASTAVPPVWLALDPGSPHGINAGAFDVRVTRTDLAPGAHDGAIAIDDPHATNTPLVVPVRCDVVAPRLLCVGTDTIVLKVTAKRPSMPKHVVVRNCGGAFGPDVIEWTARTSTPWLAVSHASGVEGESFALSTNAAGFPPGTYDGSVILEGRHSLRGTPVANSPLVVPVLLDVEPEPPVIASTGAMATGDVRTLANALGQEVAAVRLRAGAVSDVTVRAFPFQLPPGVERRRYAMRTYTFDVTGAGYVVDLTMYRTASELLPMVIDRPEDLRARRQYPSGGAWHASSSDADALGNSVTAYGVTDARGNWTMSVPWFPDAPPFPLTVSRAGPGRARLSWMLDAACAPTAIAVERRMARDSGWALGAKITPVPSGRYALVDAVEQGSEIAYRVVAFCGCGGMRESEVAVLRADGTPDPPFDRISVGPCAPQPFSRSHDAAIDVPYAVPAPGRARLSIFDARGRECRVLLDGDVGAGSGRTRLRAADLEPGVYFVRLEANGNSTAAKVLVVQ